MQTWKWGCFLPCSQKAAEFQEAMNVLSTWESGPSIHLHVWKRGTCSHFKKNPDLKHLRSNSVYMSRDIHEEITSGLTKANNFSGLYNKDSGQYTCL